MRKTITAAGAMLSILLAVSVQAKENSFAQKDKAGHLLAYMTEGEDLPGKPGSAFFGIPDTGLIVSVVRDDKDRASLRFEAQGEITREIPLDLSVQKKDKLKPWPMYVRWEGETWEGGYALLLGVVSQGSKYFSGGEANDSWLHLFRVDNPGSDAGRARQVLMLPLAAAKNVRACFSEQDEAARQGICHDSYKFEAALTLDTANDTAWPTFIYQSGASAQPGLLTTVAELPKRTLTEAELAEKQDATCSLKRTVQFNPLSRHYEMEGSGPDCDNYFVPSLDTVFVP